MFVARYYRTEEIPEDGDHYNVMNPFMNQTWRTNNKITPGCLGNKTTNYNQTCFARMEIKKLCAPQKVPSQYLLESLSRINTQNFHFKTKFNSQQSLFIADEV